MKDKLIVKNFGSIQDVELNLLPCMVFIGESGSGKSTIMKLISLMRWIYKQDCLRSIYKTMGLTSKEIEKIIRFRTDDFFKKSELDGFLSEKTYILFERENYKITIENKKLSTNWINPENLSFEKIVFISENRGFLANVIDDRNTNKNINFNHYLQDTLDNFLKASNSLENNSFKHIIATNVLLKQKKYGSNGTRMLIEGNNKNGQNFELKYEHSSSGTKNAAPIEMIIDYYSNKYNFIENFQESFIRNLFIYSLTNELNLDDFHEIDNIKKLLSNRPILKENLTLLIEEPELGLFPSNQRSLLNYLIQTCFNKTKQKNINLIISTHSPYLLNHLNLLIKSHDENNSSQTEGASLNYENLGVFLLENGKAINLKAKNMNYLNTQILSDDINDIYEKYDSLSSAT